VQGDPGTEDGADQDPRQAAEQEAQQATAVAGQVNAADGAPLVEDRLADGLFEQGMRQRQFNPGEHAGFRAFPVRQQPATAIEHVSLGDFFGGGNQAEGFGGGAAVVEHHGRFHGVIDGAGDQVQVVFGVDPQRQHAEQGQGDTGQRHRHQRQDHVPSTDDGTQGRSYVHCSHEAGARRRDSCNTLG